jgi:Zn finger protein HypA/HybF involved in hydrogenase expression
MRSLDKNALGKDEDWYGNNAAIACPECGKVFLSSQVLHRKGRPCPQCGKFRLTVRSGSAEITANES